MHAFTSAYTPHYVIIMHSNGIFQHKKVFYLFNLDVIQSKFYDFLIVMYF